MLELNLQVALDRSLAARPFFPCCLLVHPDVKRLQQLSERLEAHYAWPTLSLGTVLSEALLSVVPEQRPSKVHSALTKAVQQHIPGPVLCTDIDILFEPTLSLDPLRLLREASRVVPLITTWPGTFANSVLAYAEPAQAHYRAWTRPELCPYCIISV